MPVADAGHHRGDMAVAAIEPEAALHTVPRERRQPELDRRHGFLLACDRTGGERGDVQPYRLRIGRHRAEP